MRDYYLTMGASPTEFRYIDWILTVPLMCVEFYLLTRPYGAKGKTLFMLIAASIGMLVTGYIGEAIYPESTIFWGTFSTVFYLYIVYEVFAGDVAKLAKSSDNPALGQATTAPGFVQMFDRHTARWGQDCPARPDTQADPKWA